MMKLSALRTQFLGAISSRRLLQFQPLGLLYNSGSRFANVSKAATAGFTESFYSQSFPPNPNVPSVSEPGLPWGQSSRIFARHCFFKGNVALTVEPKAPVFSALDSGGIKLSKEGCIFFQFVPAIGTQQYDWDRKQIFALSILEIGTLLSLSPKESCEFIHDPHKGKSDEGKIKKVLQIIPFAESSGYIFRLGVSNKILNVDEHLHLPITKAEFAVMQSAFNFILPHLMGWHAFTGSRKPEEPTCVRSGNSGIQENFDLQWGRLFDYPTCKKMHHFDGSGNFGIHWKAKASIKKEDFIHE